MHNCAHQPAPAPVHWRAPAPAPLAQTPRQTVHAMSCYRRDMQRLMQICLLTGCTCCDQSDGTGSCLLTELYPHFSIQSDPKGLVLPTGTGLATNNTGSQLTSSLQCPFSDPFCSSPTCAHSSRAHKKEAMFPPDMHVESRCDKHWHYPLLG